MVLPRSQALFSSAIPPKRKMTTRLIARQAATIVENPRPGAVAPQPFPLPPIFPCRRVTTPKPSALRGLILPPAKPAKRKESSFMRTPSYAVAPSFLRDADYLPK